MKLKLTTLGVTALAMTAMPMVASAQVVGTDNLLFSGERAVECEVEFDSTGVNFDQLGRRGQAARMSVRGDVFCNQPSEVTFESDNGYMKLIGSSANQASDATEVDLTSAANFGFSAGLDYSAFIPAIGIGADTTNLLAATPVSLPGVPALNQNNVRIVFDTIAQPQPLLGGAYQDTLTVTLTPQGV